MTSGMTDRVRPVRGALLVPWVVLSVLVAPGAVERHAHDCVGLGFDSPRRLGDPQQLTLCPGAGGRLLIFLAWRRHTGAGAATTGPGRPGARSGRPGACRSPYGRSTTRRLGTRSRR